MKVRDEKNLITAEALRALMHYDADTGIFTWLTDPVRGPRRAGSVVGTVVWPGYLSVNLNFGFGQRVKFYLHRLAWLYVHGEWPLGVIDHIDGDKSHNAIANLREATSAQNAARRETKRTIAPSRGVYPHGPGYVARIHHAGKRHYLGYFSRASDAKAAYEAKAREIHGEFAHVERETDFDRATAQAVARSPHRDWLVVGTLGFGA